MAIGASHLLLFHQTQPELKLKGNSSSNEACLFPGKCLLLNFLGRCKRTAGKRWKPYQSICFLWNVFPARPPPPKYQNTKLLEPKYRCRDDHCPPCVPPCSVGDLPRSMLLLLLQLYPAKHRRFYQGINLHWLRLNFNQSIKLEKEIWEKPNCNLSRSITCFWTGFLGVWSKVVKTTRGYLCTQRWKYKTGHFLRQSSTNIQRL